MKVHVSVLRVMLIMAVAAICITPVSAVDPQTPKPEWVPDPSAGHYDCPNGWMAYTKSEPEKWSPGGATMTFASGQEAMSSAVFITPPLDKKGHILGVQPPVPICIKESK